MLSKPCTMARGLLAATRPIALLGTLFGAVLTALACSSAPPLAGRIWDVRHERFVAFEDLQAEASRARILLLGEVHDNSEHHHAQLELLRAASAARRPALVMEQFDREYQAAIDAERARPAPLDLWVERVLDAGRFDRHGWQVNDYRPLVALALERGLPIVAGNLSRSDARTLMRRSEQVELPPVDPRVEQALAAEMIEAHCGKPIEASRLKGLVVAQRARDAALARAVGSAGPDGAVLIAGGGHVRADRGVPLYLPAALAPLSVGFVEVEADKSAAAIVAGLSDEAKADKTRVYDYVWFTAPAKRADPCAQ